MKGLPEILKKIPARKDIPIGQEEIERGERDTHF